MRHSFWYRCSGAHQPEKCGIKGVRILRHPSIAPLLNNPAHCPDPPPVSSIPVSPLECSEGERANKIGVRYELNYWDMAPTKERKAWRALQDMWAAAPDSATEHYRATAEAINRMRIARGPSHYSSYRTEISKPPLAELLFQGAEKIVAVRSRKWRALLQADCAGSRPAGYIGNEPL